MNILTSKVWPLVASLLVAYISFTAARVFIYFLYPYPLGFEFNNPTHQWFYFQALPPTALAIIVASWALAAFAGGYIATRLSKQTSLFLTGIIVAVLYVFTLYTNYMASTLSELQLLSVLPFAVFGYLGHRLVVRKQQ